MYKLGLYKNLRNTMVFIFDGNGYWEKGRKEERHKDEG